LAAEKDLKAAGVAEVMVFCVNDGAVMAAWKKDQNVPEDSIIKFYADPNSELVSKMGTELTHDGPRGKLGHGRSKRTATIVDDGIVQWFAIAEAEGDPAGDDKPDATMPEAVLAALS
jgi:peroxiredoxin